MLDLVVRTLPGDHLRPMHQNIVDLPPDVARLANQAVYMGGDAIGEYYRVVYAVRAWRDGVSTSWVQVPLIMPNWVHTFTMHSVLLLMLYMRKHLGLTPPPPVPCCCPHTGRLAGMATQMGVAQASTPLMELSKGVSNMAGIFGGETGGPITDSMQSLADEVAAFIGTGAPLRWWCSVVAVWFHA